MTNSVQTTQILFADFISCFLFHVFFNHLHRDVPQPTFTCSKLTIETLKQGVKYRVVLVSLLLTLKMFHTLF